jgi:hypothetical protein
MIGNHSEFQANGLLMAHITELLQITPRIVKTGCLTTVNFESQWFDNHHIPPPDSVIISNVSGHPYQTIGVIPDQVYLKHKGDLYQLHYTFPNEGEYLLLLDTPSGIEIISLYAVENDLFHRRPYRGDVHMHSNRSDGKENPSYVAAACRRIGLDFMALTDHWKYAPSLEAIQAFKHVTVDLRIYPGEEVHIPPRTSHHNLEKVTNSIHIVNFGGQFSINDWIRENNMIFDHEVKVRMGQLIHFPSNLDKRSYAECVWCFDKIREAGGLGIFCHPYWINRYRYDIPETLTNLLFEYQPYDALELLGGYHRSEFPANHLQVARYHEERGKGKRIPVVGVSDAHGCNTGELFGWYTTLVFSPSLDFMSLKQSIMDLYSVAVESVPGSDTRAHGPFRLVKYAQYLLQNILPVHDALSYEEGLQMTAYLNDDKEALSQLQKFQGRVTAFFNRMWDSGSR